MTVTSVLPCWTSIMAINITESTLVMPSLNARMFDRETTMILLVLTLERKQKRNISLIVSSLNQKCRGHQMPTIYWPMACWNLYGKSMTAATSTPPRHTGRNYRCLAHSKIDVPVSKILSGPLQTKTSTRPNASLIVCCLDMPYQENGACQRAVRILSR